MKNLAPLHPDLPGLIDALLKMWGRSWAALDAGELRVGKEVLTAQSLQWLLINLDPVLWGECNLLNRPEDGQGLWSYFDYQRPSLRHIGNVVHQDGAEVGKSREIVTLALWSCLGAQKGSVLVGSALDGDLDEIWDEMMFQEASNPYIAAQVTRKTTKPYRRITFANGLKILLRPAGFDGRAFRGIHVGGYLLHDEAAKVENERCWSEFWRAGKPSCEVRIYSVPTGRREIVFQRIADRAKPAPASIDSSPSALVARLFKPSPPDRKSWTRFHWPKTIMPAPYWSEERRSAYIEKYGSTDAPGYVHNVLGLPGDPEYSVFPWRLLEPCLRFVPEYRTITLHWDDREKLLSTSVDRLNPLYRLVREGGESAPAADDEEEAAIQESSLPFIPEVRETISIAGYDLWPPERRRAFLSDIVHAAVPRVSGDLAGGIDVGSSSVTASPVCRIAADGAKTLVLRIRFFNFGWDALRDALWALDATLGHPAGGWGLDATGVGAAVAELLSQDGPRLPLRPRLSPYVFNRVTEVLSEEGEPLTDPNTGQPLRLDYKELATQALERALSTRTFFLPIDPDLLQTLQDHTYSIVGSTGRRTFRKVDDHDIDGLRTLVLRLQSLRFGASATPPPVTFVAPKNNTLDALAAFGGL